MKMATSRKLAFADLPREVLFLILVHLPIPSLFVTRRVCRAWNTDSVRALVNILSVTPCDPDLAPIKACVSTDGMWYQEHLDSAPLICSGTKGRGADMRLLFRPTDNDWPVLAYFVNSEGKIEISVNSTLKTSVNLDHLYLTNGISEDAGDGWRISCAVTERPDISPGDLEAKGIPSWFSGRLVFGIPSEVYYINVDVNALEVSLGCLRHLFEAL